MGGTVRTIGLRGGMQTQPVGPPVELNPSQQTQNPSLPPALWGNADGQQFLGGYGDTSQPKYPGYQAPLEPNADDQTRMISGSWGGPMWPGSPSQSGAYQQAPLGQIRSSPSPQWGRGMMLGSPLAPMRQQARQAQQQPQAQQSSGYSGGLGQLAGQKPWPPQGVFGLVR